MNKYAIVFPGQGSQFIGMLGDVAIHYPEIQVIFEQASTTLGYDLWQLIQKGPAEKLDQTFYTQPALLTASYALWSVLQKVSKLKIDYLAGHSLGEYTALVCAKAFDFQQAIKVVAARGQYMQEAVSGLNVAMAAIVGLENQKVEAICRNACKESQEVIEPANFNSIGQVVISGHRAPIERAITIAKQEGAKMAMLIPVSVASHCSLMHPAATRLKALLDQVSVETPIFPVINNVDVACYQNGEAIREGLVRQLCSPVRWVETIQYLKKRGVTHIIECGPGKVLTGLNKRIDKELELRSVNDWTSIQAFLEEGFFNDKASKWA